MKKNKLKVTIILILIIMLLVLTGCGNKEVNNVQTNTQESQETQSITLDEAQKMITDWTNSYYSNALVELIKVDVTENTVNNESLSNYYTFAITVGTDYYTVLVNKNTSKVYLFNEEDTNNLVEINKENLKQYIKVTRYDGNGYTVYIKEENNCHLTMDRRAGGGEGEYEDSDGTFSIEDNSMKVILSNGKEYNFTISKDATITLVEPDKDSNEGITVGNYQGNGSAGLYKIEIKDNSNCHFQFVDMDLSIDSDGTYSINGNTITFKLNSGDTINCTIKNGNQIYWDKQLMTFSKK